MITVGDRVSFVRWLSIEGGERRSITLEGTVVELFELSAPMGSLTMADVDVTDGPAPGIWSCSVDLLAAKGDGQ